LHTSNAKFLHVLFRNNYRPTFVLVGNKFGEMGKREYFRLIYTIFYKHNVCNYTGCVNQDGMLANVSFVI
jgi:hypothetical protein